jgi:hypothetical protein
VEARREAGRKIPQNCRLLIMSCNYMQQQKRFDVNETLKRRGVSPSFFQQMNPPERWTMKFVVIAQNFQSNDTEPDHHLPV